MSRFKRFKLHPFRSGYEKRVRDNIESEKLKFEYEDTHLPYTTYHTYTPDFTLYGTNTTFWVECKGRFCAQDRSKMLAVKEQHPDKDIRFLFQVDNPIRKGSKTTNTMWATKYGFKSAVGEVMPTEWIKELY